MKYTVDGLSIQMGTTETERRFVWLQHPDFAGALIRIAPAAEYDRDGGFTDGNSRTVRGVTAPVRRENPYFSCKVRVDGLIPGIEYVYSVGCDDVLDGQVYRFTVPAGLFDRQSFFMISDLHINVYRRALNPGDPDGTKALARYENTLSQAAAFGDASPAFFLSIGDNVSVCNMGPKFFPDPEKYSKLLMAQYAFAEYLEFLSVPHAKTIPFASILGNHDAVMLSESDEPIGDLNNVLYDMPNDDGYSGHYEDSSSGDFWFESGSLLVVGINAMVSTPYNCSACAKEVHRAFIEKAVAACPNARWRILLCHVPAYSYVEGSGIRTSNGTIGAPTENARMAEFFHELSDPFGFDFVFTGHQHAFSRTYPILDGRVVGQESRTVERHPGGVVTETLHRPRGVIHYNVPSAYDHAFFSDLPQEPAALYPAYGVTEYALRDGLAKQIPDSDKFEGVTYRSATYVHVAINGDEMTVSAVRSDTNEVFETLVVKK